MLLSKAYCFGRHFLARGSTRPGRSPTRSSMNSCALCDLTALDSSSVGSLRRARILFSTAQRASKTRWEQRRFCNTERGHRSVQLFGCGYAALGRKQRIGLLKLVLRTGCFWIIPLQHFHRPSRQHTHLPQKGVSCTNLTSVLTLWGNPNMGNDSDLTVPKAALVRRVVSHAESRALLQHENRRWDWDRQGQPGRHSMILGPMRVH